MHTPDSTPASAGPARPLILALALIGALWLLALGLWVWLFPLVGPLSPSSLPRRLPPLVGPLRPWVGARPAWA